MLDLFAKNVISILLIIGVIKTIFVKKMKEIDSKKSDKKKAYIPENIIKMEPNFSEKYYKEQVKKEERLIKQGGTKCH